MKIKVNYGIGSYAANQEIKASDITFIQTVSGTVLYNNSNIIITEDEPIAPASGLGLITVHQEMKSINIEFK